MPKASNSMVNGKSATFRVSKQAPSQGAPSGSILNYRKSAAKRSPSGGDVLEFQEVRSSQFTGAPRKRKRKAEGQPENSDSQAWKFTRASLYSSPGSVASQPRYDASSIGTSTPEPSQSIDQRRESTDSNLRRTPRPLRLRTRKPFTGDVTLDCWFTIWSFSHPSELLRMREKIPYCFRFLRDNPNLWNLSRWHHYGTDLPEIPSEPTLPGFPLNEFQYAQLRHGLGCQSCKAHDTRKTYWAFLRRWCKSCFESKIIKEREALSLLQAAKISESQPAMGGDLASIQTILQCVPSGMLDSWGNFVGVGPSQAQSLKTVYLGSDVERLITEYDEQAEANKDTWESKVGDWARKKQEMVNQRREFARAMEQWENRSRTEKCGDHQSKKEARKKYFAEKAKQLDPPMNEEVLKRCPSYARSVKIPKDPNPLAWTPLKPKLERERAAAEEQWVKEEAAALAREKEKQRAEAAENAPGSAGGAANGPGVVGGAANNSGAAVQGAVNGPVLFGGTANGPALSQGIANGAGPAQGTVNGSGSAVQGAANGRGPSQGIASNSGPVQGTANGTGFFGGTANASGTVGATANASGIISGPSTSFGFFQAAGHIFSRAPASGTASGSGSVRESSSNSGSLQERGHVLGPNSGIASSSGLVQGTTHPYGLGQGTGVGFSFFGGRNTSSGQS